MAFSLDLSVLIKDPIYGYVELTELERRVIETSIFQRLRFITQNGLAFYTYPALRGTRFEHSIGVCHLAGRVMNAIVEHSQEETLRKFLSGYCSSLQAVLPEKTYKELTTHCNVPHEGFAKLSKCELRDLANFMAQLIRLVALLHDIGHLPFSHLGEEALEPFVEELLGKEDFREYQDLGCKLHEYIGYKIITTGLGGLKEVFQSVEDQFYLQALQSVYRSKYKKQLPDGSVLRLLSDLVDSDIDVDRGDYLRRDGYNSGIGFGHYDVDRLIESIRFDIVNDDDGERLIIAPTDSSISPVEDFLLERYKLYKWLYYHHSIKYFNACLAKSLDSIIRLKPFLSGLYEEKFRLQYFHYTRYVYENGFICNEIWLWDVFQKAFIDLKAIKEPTPEVKEAIVYLDVIINRAKRGFSVWKTHPSYLKFNEILQEKLCTPRKSSSAGLQYHRMFGDDLKALPPDRFFNEILWLLKNKATPEIKHSFSERFYKQGIAVPYREVRAFSQANLNDSDIIGRVFLSVNKLEPFRESKRLSKRENVVSSLEFLIRKPEEGKKVIRLTDVSRLVKSLYDVWRSDIQCYLYFIVTANEYSGFAQKEGRSQLEEKVIHLFCNELKSWLEGKRLLTVES